MKTVFPYSRYVCVSYQSYPLLAYNRVFFMSIDSSDFLHNVFSLSNIRHICFVLLGLHFWGVYPVVFLVIFLTERADGSKLVYSLGFALQPGTRSGVAPAVAQTLYCKQIIRSLFTEVIFYIHICS